MSTNDVPGANPSNSDELAMGCWAEHADGSMILVENTEGNRVIYSVFDMSKKPPHEYRDSMPEVSFKKTFTWDPKSSKSEKWTWHDKTQFPWDKIIKDGFTDGYRLPAAQHTLNAAEEIIKSREKLQGGTAAERVAEALALQGRELDKSSIEHRFETLMSRMEGIFGKLGKALSRLPQENTKSRNRRSR